ncbi:MAG TPA: TMEM143 family protein [Pirellulales bacterium]|nr:TMEM143 family protein [Pirellulales bacterium]
MATATRAPQRQSAPVPRETDDSPPLEHFIPLRKAELIEALCSQPNLTAAEIDKFRRLCALLDATLHFEYHTHLEELKSAYASFDPDADTQSLVAPSEPERGLQLDALFDRFTWLLERANFRKLTQADVEQALNAASHQGLHLEIDFDCFDRLDIYSRGEATQTQRRRTWKRLYRFDEAHVQIFRRLVIIFKLRSGKQLTRKLDTDDVFIKLFKDIPKVDLEMLLPGTRVRMSLLDRCKIIMPTVSGLAISAFKAVKGALVAAAAGIYGILAVLGMTVGYGVKSFYGYLQTKQKYQLNLTESLYYQNLDNNAGVLCRLLDEAEEQENREAVLGYFFLWQQMTGEAATADELDRRIERFLGDALAKPVDFEVSDALEKLLRLGLAERVGGHRYTAVPLDDALRALDRAWDNYFSYHAA